MSDKQPIKTCKNCAYRDGDFGYAGRCLAVGDYMSIERQFGTRCGQDWKLWKQRRSRARRFLAWLLNW